MVGADKSEAPMPQMRRSSSVKTFGRLMTGEEVNMNISQMVKDRLKEGTDAATRQAIQDAEDAETLDETTAQGVNK